MISFQTYLIATFFLIPPQNTSFVSIYEGGRWVTYEIAYKLSGYVLNTLIL